MAEEKKAKKPANQTLAKAVEASRVVERPVQQEGNRMDFSQANFSKKDLTTKVEKNNPDSPFQYSFKSAILNGVNFSGANLEGQNFQGANLKGADFSGANCKNCDFRWATLNEIIFDEETDFTGANFWEAHGVPSA